MTRVRIKTRLYRCCLTGFFMAQSLINVMGCFYAPFIIGSLIIGAGGKDGRHLQALIGFSRPHDFNFYQIGLIIEISINIGFNIDNLIDELVRIKNGE